jgi:hypothetical protein
MQGPKGDKYVKASEIFDICHGRYRGLRDWLSASTGAVRSITLATPSSGYHWRPNRARACEYVADFERIGRHALRRPEWKGRLKLFEIYFLATTDYKNAIRTVGVAEGTFDYWYREVKRTLGAEYSRTGLFPPANYFELLRGTAPYEAAAAPENPQDVSLPLPIVTPAHEFDRI